MKIPVVIQYREILAGDEKGRLKKVEIWCKHIEDVIKHRNKNVVINGPNCPAYRIVETSLEIRDDVEIKETYEEVQK